MTKRKANTILLIFLSLFFLVGNQRVEAQQADYWIFGYKSGLHFNPLFSKPEFTNSMISEACLGDLGSFPSAFSASISDCEGNLLFYTNVSVVFNRNHDTMLNGAMCEYGSQVMYGTPTILERKDSVGKYLLLNTVLGPKNGLVATLVDMSLDNGNGGVYAKDISINDSLYGRFAVQQHPNGIDYWVVFRPTGSFFVALQLSPSGTILDRVESMDISGSYTPSLYYSTGDADHCVKFSNNGRMIAVNNLHYGGFSSYLYQFNPNTGKISLPKPLTQASWHNSLNNIQFEFSPNDSFVYASITSPHINPNLARGHIFQLPTYLPNPTFSPFTFNVAGKKENYGIQLAPDGRIYFLNPGDSSFGVFLYPNRPGSQAGMIETYIKFPFRLHSVLPNISTPFKQLDLRHNAESGQCVDTFNVQIQGGLAEFRRFRIEWGDGDSLILDSSYQSESIPHTYQSEGIYPIRLTAWTKDCLLPIVRRDTVSIRIRPSGRDTVMELRSLCGADFVELKTSSIHTDSLIWRALSLTDTLPWRNGKPMLGTFTDSVTLSDTNTYLFSITRFKNNGCTSANPINYTPDIEPRPLSSFLQPADTLHCAPFALDYINQSTNATSVSVSLNATVLTEVGIDTFSHILTDGGSYAPVFVAMNGDGCADSLIGNTIRILERPILDYQLLLDSTCDSSGFRIIDRSLNSDSIDIQVQNLDFSLVFSDMLPVQSSIFHADTGNGNYVIAYAGINAVCRVDSHFTVKTTKMLKPGMRISGVSSSYCMPAELLITDNNTDPLASSYTVFFNGIKKAENLSGIPLAQGSYNLKVIEEFANGCQSGDSGVFSVFPAPETETLRDTFSDCTGFHVALRPKNSTTIDSVYILRSSLPLETYAVEAFDPSVIWTYSHTDSAIEHSFLWLPVSMDGCRDTAIFSIQQSPYRRLDAPEIKLLRVTDNTSALLRWNYPEGTQFGNAEIKDMNGSYPISLDTSEIEKVLLSLAPADGPVSVQIKAVDSCGIGSDSSGTHTTIWLQSERFEDISFLSWTDYQGWDIGTLHLDLLQENGTWKTIASGLENANTYGDPSYSEALMDNYCYRIKASKEGEDSLYTLSNISCVAQAPLLLIPNAFTPNGDRLNDLFQVYSLSNASIEMTIYSRWGEQIYSEKSSSPSWDGSYRDIPAEEGIYLYIIQVLTNEGRKYTLTGSIELLR